MIKLLKSNWLALSIVGTAFLAGTMAAISFASRSELDRQIQRVNEIERTSISAARDASAASQAIQELRREVREQFLYQQKILLDIAREYGIRPSAPPELKPLK